MLCSEIFGLLYEDIEVVQAPKQGPVEVGNTTVIINPSFGDTARMFAQINAAPLRALAEPGRFVIWPAEDAMHQVVQIALRMDRRARRYIIFASTRDSGRDAARVGRYFVSVMNDRHETVPAKSMETRMKAALGIR